MAWEGGYYSGSKSKSLVSCPGYGWGTGWGLGTRLCVHAKTTKEKLDSLTDPREKCEFSYRSI